MDVTLPMLKSTLSGGGADKKKVLMAPGKRKDETSRDSSMGMGPYISLLDREGGFTEATGNFQILSLKNRQKGGRRGGSLRKGDIFSAENQGTCRILTVRTLTHY